MAGGNITYKVIIEDQVFKLTKAQIHTDSPNYFTFHLIDKSEEEVELTRDPHLFRIIVDYLNGYCVIPLRLDRLPPTMTPDIALANLRADADLEYRKQRLFHHYLMIVHLGKGKLEAVPLDHFHAMLVEKRQFDDWFRYENKYTDRANKYQLAIAAQVRGVTNRILKNVSAQIQEWDLLGWSKEYKGDNNYLRTIVVQVWSQSELSMRL
ncbi:hypothetical protein RHS01_09043 [Rhizoctonia solani]|uniref:BTB domain-containing protein n=1 Tax=Rhizoctonia solani TaxID=456999 RepID=A0A8H7M1S1_9AGAM|nr:hypothetical protein RHS01_09043 [Rhizoctonia solani]